MAIAVTCPKCQSRFEVPGDLADQPIQCARCLHVFERGGKAPSSVGIQAGAAPMPVADPRREEPRPLGPPLNHPEPRAPFPVMSLVIVVIGLMFFLLVLSGGFNVWMILTPDNQFRVNQEADRAQKVAKAQRQIAEDALRQAKQNMDQVEKVEALLKRQIDQLRQERDDALEKLEDAQRRLAKQAK